MDMVGLALQMIDLMVWVKDRGHAVDNLEVTTVRLKSLCRSSMVETVFKAGSINVSSYQRVILLRSRSVYSTLDKHN